MKEKKNIYEGELTSFKVGIDKFTDLTLTIKTLKGSKSLRLSHSLLVVINKERISIGDIIYIECNSGIIKRLGRSEAYKQDCDIESDRYVPIPKGSVYRTREVVQEMSLHDLDKANMKPNAGAMGLVLNNMCVDNKEYNEDIVDEVDKIVKGYVENGSCEVKEEILVIEDGEVLSEECVRYLEYVYESGYCPFVFVMFEEDGVLDQRMYAAFLNIKLEYQIGDELFKMVESEHTNQYPGLKDIISEVGNKYGYRQAHKLVNLLKVVGELNDDTIKESIAMLGLNKI